MTVWSPQQDAALRAVDAWLKSPEKQVFRLFGYAGTGKTTLARHLAEGVDGLVEFGAFTGKAAHVLRQKGCYGARTIHSMIYVCKDKSRQRLAELEDALANAIHEAESEADPEHVRAVVDRNPLVSRLRAQVTEERQNLARPMFTLNHDSEISSARLIVIDECSMVDGQMGEDLLSFDVPVLVLGDPAQLPPVRGGGFFTDEPDPDVMLTEIHRQAADNPIIAMATRVRQGEPLLLGSYGESIVMEGKPAAEDDLACGQVLVGKNVTRRASNARIRELRGLPAGWPVAGDRLVCLRNENEIGLLNGAIWNVVDTMGLDEDTVGLSIVSEDTADELEVVAHTHYFQGREDQLGLWSRKEAQEFDFGYAMTVHKAQGSQWDDVMLFDESRVFRADRNRWLYTGLTRAAERVTVVRR